MAWSSRGERVITTLLLALLTLVVSLSDAFSRVDNMLFDIVQRHAPRQPPDDVVLVTIDEQSLDSLGRWPWPRRWHAQLIDRLHADGARVIGIDILFSEPQQDDPQADAVLARAMARAGNVVLPVTIEQVRANGQLIESLPIPPLTEHARALGRVHAQLDADTIARSIFLQEGLGQAVWPHFAQAMLSAASERPAHGLDVAPSTSGVPWSLSKQGQRYINFSTARHQFASVSYVQALSGQFSPGIFKNKLVLVGSTAEGLADRLPTPVSGLQQPMPGVIFLANAMVSMREGTLIQRTPFGLNVILACALAMVPMWWLPRVSSRRGLIGCAAYSAMILAVIMVLPITLHLWAPLSASLVGILSAYPLWAWRKLESAHAYLDKELARLQHQLQIVDTHSVASAKQFNPAVDVFQQRIAQLHAVTHKLEKQEQDQREILAFLSHDIRVPLSSAAAHIEHHLGAHHPAFEQISLALRWTEKLLQIARAKMLNPSAFVDVDITAVLHEAVDAVYPLLQKQGLKLDVDIPTEPAWVHGNHDMLLRAVNNLLSNALKYSPAHGRISLRGRLKAEGVSITVSDQGPGISPKVQAYLFKPHSHSIHTVQASGTGLGLYFVKTVVQQHGGSVHLQRADEQTVFEISLPLNLT